jgi:acetyl esterase/lipase
VVTARTPERLPAFFDELAAWAAQRDEGAETLRYGAHPDQELDLRLPPSARLEPLALVLHGGFWRAAYTKRNTAALAVALTEAGWATANVEYRRPGRGSWRPLLEDVAAAAAAIGRKPDVAVGHSAGGHLALWLAARGDVAAAVALAGVSDLAGAAAARVGADAVQEFLGGEPEDEPDAYAEADPAQRLPSGVPQLLVHGVDDDRVPISLSRAYANRARAAGDDCRVLELAAADHFDLIDPRHAGWARIRDAIAGVAPSAA